MNSKVIFLLCLFATCAFSSFYEDWEKQEAALESENLSFYVALPQHNLDKLEALLYAVSDPQSPEYGKHATEDEIRALVNPTKKEHDKVFYFFKNAGSSLDITSYGDALKITGSISDLSKIFSAKFFWHQHTPSGHKVVRTDKTGIQIPSEISSDITFITGLVSFPIVQKNDKKGMLAANSTGYFAPSTIRTLYNVPQNAQTTNSKSSQGAIEFTPEAAFSFADYLSFTQKSNEKFFNFTHIVGPFGNVGDNGESELDVQLLGTIGLGAENWFWTINDGWLYEMAVQVFNAKSKPWVLSISYGWPELLTCGSITNANCTANNNGEYITRANTEMQKLGALGISLIASSGDAGAPSTANVFCSNTTHPIFALYPGSSPYVTSVSATAAIGASDLPSIQPPICKNFGCSNTSTEVPCDVSTDAYGWTTGGGFSEFTPRPSFQDIAVLTYLKSNVLPPLQYFTTGNRGYPDVSAIGARVLTVDGGVVSITEGTSASAPIIAGLVTLLNDYRFNNGKPSLGWMNPMLYQMAAANTKAFKDITTGNNKCTEYGYCCTYGYGATTGWDAITGLGTPNYGLWLDYVKQLKN